MMFLADKIVNICEKKNITLFSASKNGKVT